MFSGLSLKKILKNSSAQLIVRSTTAASTLITIFLITYLQGFQFLGSITKVIAYVSIFYTIIDFGLNAIYIKKYFNSILDNIHKLIVLRFIISIIVAIIAIAITQFLPYNQQLNSGFSPQEKLGIVIFSLTLVTFSISLSLQAVLQKTLSYQKAVIPSVVSSLVLVVFVALGTQLQNLLLILAGYPTSTLLFTILLANKVLQKKRGQLKKFKEFSKEILKDSIPLAIVLAFSLVHTKSDMVILSILQTNKDIGIYGFSYRIFDFLLTIPAFLTASMYPLLLKARSTPKFSQSIKKYTIFLLLTSFCATFFTLLLSPMLGLIKQEFTLSVLPLQILTISLPLFFITGLFQWVLIVSNRMKSLMIIYCVATTLNIMLNIVFIPSYSYIAASIVTLFSEALVLLLLSLTLVIYKTKIFQNAK